MVPALASTLLGLLAAIAVVALPVDEAPYEAAPCAAPKLRRGWHTFTDAEKKAYLDAELCLMKTPSTSGIRGSKTKFDDFQAAHVLQTEIAHFVGQFLPFHRLFVWAHEQALQKDCGYTGAQPYWDESLDAGAFSKAPILDAVLGFGGDGTGPDNCIETGPFANYTNPLGPGYTIADHCISRQISDAQSAAAAPAVVARCMNTTRYLDFWPCVEGGPHGAGHGGIGAEMLNPVSSPGDPIFFMHHTWLDRMWSKWQDQDPAARLKDMGGNNRANMSAMPTGPFPTGGFPGWGGVPTGTGAPPTATGSMPPMGTGGPGGGFMPWMVNMTRPADVPAPEVIGDPGNTTTLTHLIYLYGLVQNRTVGELMDTRGFLCYEYD